MKTIRTFLVAALFALMAQGVSAQEVFTDDNKVAVKGYDVVNYFTTNTAARGSKDFSTEHNGATYYFLSAENLETFKASPDQYLPQYGGYCAFAIAKMSKAVPVDPETFRIDDGKLYLFYNDLYEGKPLNTIVPWLSDEAEMEKLAAENWKKMSH